MAIIAVIAPGTRGDVEPMRSIAYAIAETGLANVLFASHQQYEEEEEEGADGIEFRTLTSPVGDVEGARGSAPVQGARAESHWHVGKCVRPLPHCIDDSIH